ncbi:unnamed protein product [Symbiodinium natans]|uniref:Uncharacterized protein n=1 Tax=Symbiodinium natans TaxID=878477 RepID=A0A812J9S5_9DINO|nr:unnamed protein product [Symbiodinium natans]
MTFACHRFLRLLLRATRALSRVNMPTPTTPSSRRMCVFVDAPIAVIHVQMHVARVFALLIAPADVVHVMSAWQMPLLRPLCSRPAPVDGRVVRVLLPLPVEQASVLPTASARVVLAHKGPRAIAARRCPRLHQPKRAAVMIATLKLDPIVLQATVRSIVIAEAAHAGHGCTLSLRNLLIVTHRRVDACVAMTTVGCWSSRTAEQDFVRSTVLGMLAQVALVAMPLSHVVAGVMAVPGLLRTLVGPATVKHTVSVLGAAVSRTVVLGTRGPPPLSRKMCRETGAALVVFVNTAGAALSEFGAFELQPTVVAERKRVPLPEQLYQLISHTCMMGLKVFMAVRLVSLSMGRHPRRQFRSTLPHHV